MKSWAKIGLFLSLCSLCPLYSIAGPYEEAWELIKAGKNEEGLNQLKKAAAEGNPDAQGDLGNAYLNGTLGVKKDKEQAFKLFKEAAKKGHGDAVFKLRAFFTPFEHVEFERNRGQSNSRNGKDEEKGVGQEGAAPATHQSAWGVEDCSATQKQALKEMMKQQVSELNEQVRKAELALGLRPETK